MEWFNGGVADAIAAAKSKSAVFVVVVLGKRLEIEFSVVLMKDIFTCSGDEADEASKSLCELLLDPEIIGLFSPMVCIKVENGSSTCKQFAAIYPVVIIPSIYFIGHITRAVYSSKSGYEGSWNNKDRQVEGF